MTHILPKPLTKGDTIGIIAPSGPITDSEAILRGKNYLEKLGYNVILSEHVFDKDRYLSSSDKNRLEDLHWAFENPQINTIICARGGYGALRLINDINYELIKKNPKNFCGYSDITVLSLLFLKKSNLITFSSPMIKGDFGKIKKDKYTMNSFFSALENNHIELKAPKVIKKGKASGIIWGGNLASITSLCGTDFIPDNDLILFTEDLNEPIYKIDKMLTQLINIKEFRKNLKGIAFGEFIGIDNTDQLEYLFSELANKLDIPIISGLKISHNSTKDTIPIGKTCILNNNKLSI